MLCMEALAEEEDASDDDEGEEAESPSGTGRSRSLADIPAWQLVQPGRSKRGGDDGSEDAEKRRRKVADRLGVGQEREREESHV